MLGSIIFGVFSLVFCGLFCWIRTEKPSVYSLVLKIMSSLCFVLCGFFAVKVINSSTVNLLVLIGLIFGLVGDILLDLKIMYPNENDQYFVSGTISFAIGHIFYFISALSYNIAILPNNVWWNILASVGIAIVLTLAIVFSSKKMGLNFGKMLPIVIGYSFMLTFMVAYTFSIAIFNPVYLIFAFGMLLFFASDLVLSMQYFGNKTAKVLVYVNHFLYYMAQVLLAFSLLFLI